MLLIKNPAGANEASGRSSTAGAPPRRVALNDAIADGRDVSWIWDVDFEPLLDGLERARRSPATAPPSSRCASSTRACRGGASRSCPASRRALDRGLELRRPGGELVVLPTYTAMLGAAQDRSPRAGTCAQYWERAA